MAWTAEVWNLPESATHERIIASLPVSDVTWKNGIGISGNGSASIPMSYSRLSEIISGPQNVQSLIRLFWDDKFAFAFFPEYTSKPYKDESGTLMTLNGDGVRSMSRFAIAYPYDYPAMPFKTADHMYGNITPAAGFSNGSFDDFILNGGAEEGEISPWKSTTDSSDFFAPDTGVVVQAADVRSGSYAFEIDPSTPHSGMVRDIPVLPNQQYVFQVYIKEPTANGDRYTMGIQMGEGSTLDVGAHIYNDTGLCELDGAAYRGGQSDGTWQVVDGTITFGPEVETTKVYIQYDDHVSGSSLLYRVDDFTVSGPGIGLEPWEPIGEWGTFELDDTKQKDGTYSLKFQAKASSAATKTGVRQQLEKLIIGKTYTWSAYFQHDGAGDEPITMIVKKPSGKWMSSQTVQIPTGTGWTYATTTFVAESTSVWIDFRYGAAGVSPFFWVDEAMFAEGLPRATVGAIVIDMMDDATVDHVTEVTPGEPRSVLGYLGYNGFTRLVDSGGVVWDDDIALTIPLGQNYDQMAAQIQKLGYEMDIVWDGSSWEIELYNAGGLGTNYSGTSYPAIVQGAAVVSGEFQQAVMQATRSLGVGAEGIWTEVVRSAAEAALGRREAFTPDEQILDIPTLVTASDESMSSFERTTNGFKLTFSEYATSLPIRDFTYGDVINVILPSFDVQGDFRVDTITCKWEKNGESIFTVDFDSEVVTIGAATDVAVANLLGQFEPMTPLTDESASLLSVEPFLGPIERTYLVASSDARPLIRALADYKCSGTEDEEEINAAITRAGKDGGGRVALTAGTFNIASPINVSYNNIELVGTGREATTFEVQFDSAWDVAGAGVVKVGEFIIGTRLADFSIHSVSGSVPGPDYGSGDGYIIMGSESVVDNIRISAEVRMFWTAIYRTSTGTKAVIKNCVIEAIGTPDYDYPRVEYAIFVTGTALTDGPEECLITGNVISQAGFCIFADSRNSIITNNMLSGVIWEGIHLDEIGHIVANNTIRDSPTASVGIDTAGNSTTVVGNIIANFGLDKPFSEGISSDGPIIGNILIDAGMWSSISAYGSDVIVSGNQVWMAKGAERGVSVDFASPGVIEGNTVFGGYTVYSVPWQRYLEGIGIWVARAGADKLVVANNTVFGCLVGIQVGGTVAAASDNDAVIISGNLVSKYDATVVWVGDRIGIIIYGVQTGTDLFLSRDIMVNGNNVNGDIRLIAISQGQVSNNHIPEGQILIEDCSDITVQGNTIKGRTTGPDAAAVHLKGSTARATVWNNTYQGVGYDGGNVLEWGLFEDDTVTGTVEVHNRWDLTLYGQTVFMKGTSASVFSSVGDMVGAHNMFGTAASVFDGSGTLSVMHSIRGTSASVFSSVGVLTVS